MIHALRCAASWLAGLLVLAGVLWWVARVLKPA
jgi:hypothetical protein